MQELLIPWSEQLDEKDKELTFELLPEISTLYTDDKLMYETVYDGISTHIQQELFSSLAYSVEDDYGTNFISYVILQVLFEEILSENFAKMFTGKGFVDTLHQVSVSTKIQGHTSNIAETVEEIYYATIEEYPQITKEEVKFDISTFNFDQMNKEINRISRNFKENFISEYVNIFNRTFHSILSEDSKVSFEEFMYKVRDIFIADDQLESELERARVSKCKELINSYNLCGDKPMILSNDYDVKVYSMRYFHEYGQWVEIQDIYDKKTKPKNTRAEKRRAQRAKKKAAKKQAKKSR
ncbi:hypothetical protein CL656_03040 [bacterium]|nr:hypothetical protein [bacterium]|tara:strand:+ start:3409 stop:4296 length:888 start_codon:yes stop_codon:yes gene_type:complete